MRINRKWSSSEEDRLKLLLAAGHSKSEISSKMGRTEASIADKSYRVLAEALPRHKANWTAPEDKELMKTGNDIKPFCQKWQRGNKDVSQRKFDLLNGKITPGQNIGKKSASATVPTSGTVQTTREKNKARTLLTAFSQKEFRETVQNLNKVVFGDITKSGGASEYQAGIMNSLQGLVSNNSNVTRLGSFKQEKAIVDAAWNILSAKYNA